MAETNPRNPISDLMFDWIAILHEKAEGLNAYEKYLRDAHEADSQECIQLLERLRESDSRLVEEVRSHLTQMLTSQEVSGMERQSREPQADQADSQALQH